RRTDRRLGPVGRLDHHLALHLAELAADGAHHEMPHRELHRRVRRIEIVRRRGRHDPSERQPERQCADCPAHGFLLLARRQVTAAAKECTIPRMDANGRRRLARGAVGITLVVAVVALSRGLPADRYLLAFVAWVRESGRTGMAAFAAAYVGACVLLLPASVLTLGAGFAYGVGPGVLLVWLSASVGALVAFLLGRTLLRESIATRVARNPRFATIDRAVGAQGFRIVLLTRLSPVFPFS